MKPILIALTCLSVSIAAAQPAKVVSCKKASYTTGEKITKGQHLDHTKEIQILKGGKLRVVSGRRSGYLGPGQYNVDKIVSNQQFWRDHVLEDSIFSVLKKHKLLHCKNKIIQCHRGGDSSTQKSSVITTKEDSVTLQWDDAPGHSSKYYVVVMNVYEEYLQLIQTDKREATLNLTGLKMYNTVIYKVITEDCYESEVMCIRMQQE